MVRRIVKEGAKKNKGVEARMIVKRLNEEGSGARRKRKKVGESAGSASLRGRRGRG